MGHKKRLVTKSDFDGMVCGILLKEAGIVDAVVFAHPKDIERGNFEITDRDITAGLPYKEGVHLAFDHYPGTVLGKKNNLVVDHRMTSTSRVIYNHYGKNRFTNISEDILNAVDKGFSAGLTIGEIVYPTGWTLLNYIIDQRTGLEAFKKLSITQADLIIKLIDDCRALTIGEVLNLPDVEERLELYFSCIEEYKAQILRCSAVYSNVVVTDTRKETVIYPGNRFMVYSLFPECNISISISSDAKSGRSVFVAGKSILDRSYNKNIGSIMKKYGGGGHVSAGTCYAENAAADILRDKLIAELEYGCVKNLFMGYYNYY